jgi:hypothetical protein
MLPDALIIPFIMPANENEMFLFSKLFGFFLRVTLSLGSKEDYPWG